MHRANEHVSCAARQHAQCCPLLTPVVWNGCRYAFNNNRADGPSCTSSYKMLEVCPSRPPHRPHHTAPADSCAHVRCQVGDALLSSCPCCWRSFSPTKKAVLLVEHSFSVTFYTAVHGHAKDRQEGPAGAQQLPLTLTLTWPQAHSGQVGQVCDPLQLWVAC